MTVRDRRRRLELARLLLGALAVVAAVTAGAAFALTLALLASIALTSVALVGALVLGIKLTLWSRRRSRARHGWPAARERFQRLAAEYAAFECDPVAVLRLPALADVSVPATARFTTAFSEAQALHTERKPPAGVASAYESAVTRAEFAWSEAVAEAERRRRPAPALTAALPDWITERLYRWMRRGPQPERSSAHAT